VVAPTRSVLVFIVAKNPDLQRRGKYFERKRISSV
jgi:hypothetical protein